MIVFDTHVLYWWLASPGRLSQTAQRWIEDAAKGEGEILVPVVVLWELEYKRRSGKLPMDTPIREAWPRLRAIPGVMWESPDAEDWMLAAELEWEHRDPADRMIAAMALNRQVPVCTKDRMFHDPSSPVKAVW